MQPLKSVAYIFLLSLSLSVPVFAQSEDTPNNEAVMREALGKMPLAFEQNQGQSGPTVKYLSRGAGFNIILTDQGAEIALSNALHQEETISIRPVGAAKPPNLPALDVLTQKTNYLIGNDPTRHILDVKNYGRVQYASIYPGIDLVYYGNQRQLEYDFIVAPKADPRKIKLGFGGARKLTVTQDGGLELNDPTNGIEFRKPVAYQDIGGKHHPVEAQYVLAGNNQVTFKLGEYDPNFPLVIDPILSYATYLWGTVGGIAIDSSGNIYVAGSISSGSLPAVGGFQTSQKGTTDAYVVKLNPSFVPVYATYLGARNATTKGLGVAVDGSGNAYITGTTTSGSFPVTVGAYQTSSSTGGGFITKLNTAGSALAYSTYVKGATPKSIAVDSSGNAYTAGVAISAFVPTTGAFQANFHGGFVAKLNSTGSAMAYATYLGGSNTSDFCNAIAIDTQGNAYVVGTTFSADFPTSAPYQATLQGTKDAFVTKLNPSGTALIYSTYLGGSGNEWGKGITVDVSGQAYAVGWTSSADYPVTAGVFQPRIGNSNPSVSNGFITKFSSTGAALAYSSYIGGAWCLMPGIFSCFAIFNTGDGVDAVMSVKVDAAGYAYIGGYATSNLFSLTDSLLPNNISGNNDGWSAQFVAKITPASDDKVYSTVFSPREQDKRVNDLVIDASGNVYAVGYDSGLAFTTLTPFTAGAQLTSGLSFLVKLSNGVYTTSVQSSLTPANNTQSITFTAKVSGTPATNGTVAFMDGGTTLGTSPITQGTSTFTTTFSPGIHKITAVYSGDGKASPPIYQVI